MLAKPSVSLQLQDDGWLEQLKPSGWQEDPINVGQ